MHLTSDEMRRNILIAVIVLSLSSFSSKDEHQQSEPVRTERTVIAYIAADNDLWDVALIDLEEMKQLANEIEKVTAVHAHSNGTEYVQPLTTRQQTWRDEFPDTVPEAFAPD
jgi:hypothetical protein